MKLSPLIQRQLAFYAKILAISAAIGAAFALSLGQTTSFAVNLTQGVASGILIGLVCSATQAALGLAARRRWGRRMPLVVFVVLRALGFSLAIMIGLIVPIYLITGLAYWREPAFGTIFAISGLIALGVALATDITRLLGKEATVSLLTGRYRKPRIEDRIVMFADIAGSTALGEAIGDLRFHEFLSEVALDLSRPVEQARGDVHRYVGDAVIVTWPLDKPGSADAALQCAADMHGVLLAQSAAYKARFGAVPRLRIAIHCGHVAAGEVGDWKKEIALLGDTMNTAARIESAARRFGAHTVVSKAFFNRLSASAAAGLAELPGYAADGKRDTLSLWGMT